MRTFNTSGPNIPEKHYTIERYGLIKRGIELINDERYFTIWAPRQTGKSTYFRQLADELNKKEYAPVYFSVEGFNDFSVADVFDTFCRELKDQQQLDWDIKSLKDFEHIISNYNEKKLVIIIDEIESLNPEIFNQFLHTIRNLYHSRVKHCLKSVILVGVSNIVGVVSDNASPFNITDNLNVPYFTDAEVQELLAQHETETGQLFEPKVKLKISEITANQPGLVNGFAYKLVSDYKSKPIIEYTDYLKVEHWYLNVAIDKNFANILNKAQEFRSFVETLLFTDKEIPFKIDREAIKSLYTNGLIREDDNGNVEFWVPFYKKRLHNAFYPYTNGEKTTILQNVIVKELFSDDHKFLFDKLVSGFKTYVKRRGFQAYREKDDAGRFTSIKESALIYSFETYIQAVLQTIGAKSYREANTGLGRSDLIINIEGEEYLVETNIYYYEKQFLDGKKQLAYYCNSLEQTEGIYLVFMPNDIPHPETVVENTETISNVLIRTYIISYDERKDFGEI